MKIDKNLSEYLTIKSSEILEKFGEFLSQIEHVEKKEFQFHISYYISKYNNLAWNKVFHQIIISHDKGGGLDSFFVCVGGDILVEKEVEKKSLFGTIKKTICNTPQKSDQWLS